MQRAIRASQHIIVLVAWPRFAIDSDAKMPLINTEQSASRRSKKLPRRIVKSSSSIEDQRSNVVNVECLSLITIGEDIGTHTIIRYV